MIYNKLGGTEYFVSKICFGALTIGPLQANLSLDEGAAVIKTALNQGINFIDTAELYGTYPYIKKALEGWHRDVIIATKSYAYSREQMAQSLERARQELDRDKIEIFLMHEQESALTLAGHRPALDYLLEAKVKGLVGAVGISTHTVAGVEAAVDMPEIDVIHPMLNITGVGILDGTIDDMLTAVRRAAHAGKGLYAMKAIGGGNLIHRAKIALDWAFNLDFVHAVAIGMKSPAEVLVNCAWALGEEPDDQILKQVSSTERTLHIENWCEKCGRCVQACGYGALTFNEHGIMVLREKCVLCGYCGAFCQNFCIKVI